MTAKPARRRRRVAVSLTALVDLLFMIMFMQYIQLREDKEVLASTTREAQRERDAAESGRAAADKRRDDAIELKDATLAELQALTAQIASAKTEVAQANRERDQLGQQVAELKTRLGEAEAEKKRTEDEAREAQRQLGAMVSQMFSSVDSETVAKALENGADSRELHRIQEELEALKNQTASQVVQVLRKANEVQKRVDIWEVHLYSKGVVRLRSPGHGADAIERMLDVDNQDAFTNEFVRIATSHGTPKSLVIILYTHENAKGGMIRGVQAALEQVKTRWAADLGEKKVSVSSPSYTETAP